MAPAQVLKARMRTVTPVFCAGAEQNGPAEIRPLSIRGALRWWYRALDRDFLAKEKEYFGAAGSEIRSSPVAVRVRPWLKGDKRYKEYLDAPKAVSSGAAYLGYTLYVSKNDRRAVPDGEKFDLELLLLRPGNNEQRLRRAWAASLWLFGHLGGLGTRARRGFGTIALEHWEGWPECRELAPAHGARDPRDWKKKFEDGFKTIRGWFSPPTNARHQHLGSSVQLYISKEGVNGWKPALDQAGMIFRNFRNQPGNHKPEKLAAFGLPIRFARHPASIMSLVGANRSASRLLFRVVRINGRYHPLAWCVEGPLAPAQVQLAYRGNYKAPYAGDGLLTTFLNTLTGLGFL